MSQAIADIGAAVVAVGSIVAAPFTGGASLAGLGLAGALLQVGAAEGQQQQTQANVGNFNYGTGGSILGAGAAGAGVPGADQRPSIITSTGRNRHVCAPRGHANERSRDSR